MIYAYRLKDAAEKTGKVFDGLTVRQTWQFSSDPKIAVLKKWSKVVVLEAQDIQAAKAEAAAYDKGAKPQEAPGTGDAETGIPEGTGVDPNDPLVKELAKKNLSELKEFAKANGFDEGEYSRLTRSKLIEYIVLGMAAKEDNA